jgi:uncharacterized Fe-S cluster-containing radical SAM superfamily protein
MIGSLQITIPAGCMNHCGFCVYRQHATKFKTLWMTDHQRWSGEVERRLRYASERVSTVMITSHGEPTLNMKYIHDVIDLLNTVTPQLTHIELQTSGVGLTRESLADLYNLGIRVISLSLPALEINATLKIMNAPPQYNYNPLALTELIRSMGFMLRLSIAMTTWFDSFSLDAILEQLEQVWKPDQVSFKKLYGAGDLASKRYDEYMEAFRINPAYRKLELLPIGVWKYDARGMGVVWNDDCMISHEQEQPRYLILQPDGRLYTRWDTKASVIF